MSTALLQDAQALRDHLDKLNDTGFDYRCSGMDANNTAFFVSLIGPYADGEHVFTVSPWDGEVSFSSGPYCDECAAHTPLGLEDLTYPVRVLLPEGLTCTRPEGHGDYSACGTDGGWTPPFCGAPLFSNEVKA